MKLCMQVTAVLFEVIVGLLMSTILLLSSTYLLKFFGWVHGVRFSSLEKMQTLLFAESDATSLMQVVKYPAANIDIDSIDSIEGEQRVLWYYQE